MSQNRNGGSTLYIEPMEGELRFEMLTMRNAGFDSGETH